MPKTKLNNEKRGTVVGVRLKDGGNVAGKFQRTEEINGVERAVITAAGETHYVAVDSVEEYDVIAEAAQK